MRVREASLDSKGFSFSFPVGQKGFDWDHNVAKELSDDGLTSLYYDHISCQFEIFMCDCMSALFVFFNGPTSHV